MNKKDAKIQINYKQKKLCKQRWKNINKSLNTNKGKK